MNDKLKKLGEQFEDLLRMWDEHKVLRKVMVTDIRLELHYIMERVKNNPTDTSGITEAIEKVRERMKSLAPD